MRSQTKVWWAKQAAKKEIKNGLHGLQNRTMCYNVKNKERNDYIMDNKKLVNKIDELLAMLKMERKELKATEEEISWVNLEEQLEECKDKLDDVLYKRQIRDLCNYEYNTKFNSVDSDFDDNDVVQSIIKLIIEYVDFERSKGIKISNGTIISIFKYAITLHSHGYSINTIDYLMGVMLGALLND